MNVPKGRNYSNKTSCKLPTGPRPDQRLRLAANNFERIRSRMGTDTWLKIAKQSLPLSQAECLQYFRTKIRCANLRPVGRYLIYAN